MPYKLTDKPSGNGKGLPQWTPMLSSMRGLGLLSMKQIANHCGITPSAAKSVLGDLLVPVKKELEGRHYVEKFQDSDVASIGDKWTAGKRWREPLEEWSKKIETELSLPDTSVPTTVSAELGKALFKGQTVFHGALTVADQSPEALRALKSAHLSRIVDAIVQATLEDVPASETALSIFCLDTPTPWKMLLVLWSVQDGKLKTAFQQVSPEFYAALTSVKNS